MNLKDKRTRRITAACASAAVVTAGGVAFGIGASANGSLSLSTGTSFTTLDLGAALPVSHSVQTLTATTGLGAGDTFTLTYGGNTTTSLAQTASTANVQSALNALASVAAAGGVTVAVGTGPDLSVTGHSYVVTFTASGARTPITATVTGAGALSVTQTTTGGTLGSLAAPLANATFGTKVTSTTTGNLTLSLDSYTAPTGVTVSGTPSLLFAQQASGSATGPTGGWASLSNPAGAGSVSGTLNAAQDVFLTATKPGKYTYHFVDDNNTVGTDDDVVSSTVTMTVLDAEDATSGVTSDDWAPSVSMSKSTVDKGASVIASVPFGAVSTSDTRGATSGIGLLGSKLANLVGVAFTGSPVGLNNDLSGGATDYTAAAPLTATATGGTRTLAAGVTATAGTLTGTAKFDRNGDGLISDALGTAGTTTVQDNNVTAVLLEPTVQAAQVANGLVLDGANHVVKTTGTAAGTTVTLGAASATDLTGHRIKISKTGEPSEYATVLSVGGLGNKTLTTTSALQYSHSAGSTVTDMDAVAIHKGNKTVNYSATVTDTVDVTDKSGKTVYFTLAGTDIADVTSGATLVSSTLTTKVYSVTTDKSGIAGLIVTDNAATTAGYTVQASSNKHNSDLLTATYQDPRASIVAITTSGAALSPAVSAGQVTITGKLLDQFGANYAPAQSLNQQIDITGAVTAHPALNGGTFSYVYQPTVPTAGNTDTLNFTYADEGNPTASVDINWGSSAATSTVTLDPQAIQATVPVAKVDAFPTPKKFTGTVKDSSSAGLAFKKVTLTATQGVYFSADATGANLVNTIDVAADATGNYAVWAVFTRSGTATITATSEGKSAKYDQVVDKADNDQGYTLNITSQSAMPNSTVIVSGRVNDAFGNPVSNAQVDIVPDDITYGVLSTGFPFTNDSGDYSVTYTTGSKTGKVFLSAKIDGGAPVPVAAWLTLGGITLPTKNDVATGNINIAADAVSLSVDKASLLGGGNVTVKGNTRHNAAVDVYFKVAGEPLQLIDSVTADGNGDFSVPATVKSSGSFIAKTSTATSQAVKVTVVSTVKISARSIGKGWIRVSVSGGPSKVGTVRLYQRFRGGKVVMLSKAYTTLGGVSWKIKPGKGTFIYRATYTSAGSGTSGIVAVSIKN